jgi:16S rRNA (cytosine967-C5)-methyltransferase
MTKEYKTNRSSKSSLLIPKNYLVPGLAVRWVVLKILDHVFLEQKTLTDLKGYQNHPFSALAPEQKARALSLSDHVFRNLSALDTIIEGFVKKNTDYKIINILRIAISEMIFDQVASHAAVDSAVRLCKGENKLRHLSGLVNAVLRRISEKVNAGMIVSKPELVPELFCKLEKIYGSEVAKRISDSHCKKPFIDITLKNINLLDKFSESLGATVLPNGTLRLSGRNQVSKLYGFDEGEWWVQDCAASIAVLCAGNLKGKKVLDVCAAPGGKTMQLLSFGAHVVALDTSKKRLTKLFENLKRTKLKAEIINKNIVDYECKNLFDTIIVDAPCTASGTMRRNIDLQYIRPLERLKELVINQKLILESSMRFLKPEGVLVYSTCSLFPEEGEKLIEDILKKNTNWVQKKINVKDLGLETGWLDSFGSLRLRPDFWEKYGGMDGFFISVISKLK